MQALLRNIKKIDKLVRFPEFEPLRGLYSETYLLSAIKEGVVKVRDQIRGGMIKEIETIDGAIIRETLNYLHNNQKPKLQRVLNCTGTVLHTNLGRAILPEKAALAAAHASSHYSNLELNLESGKRGSRYDHIVEILKKLTGCEDALVVNNNAAAVLLVLTALSRGKEAIVSRGELVEIGGSFRIPNVMDFGGAFLKEVGTTNKTHLSDYEEAVSQETGLIVKVHCSNYVISGFTKSVDAEEIALLGKKKHIPVYYDLGSGALFDFGPYGIHEPTVSQLIKSGIDILSFSGDKLLGGPQGGIIVGKKKLIAKIKKNQLLRAVRVDKLTLAALEATLIDYLDEENIRKSNPTISMLTISLAELKEKADKLQKLFATKAVPGLDFQLVKMNSLSGGGSLPDKKFPSYCLSLKSPLGVAQLGEALRHNTLPIIVRIRDNALILDLRTIDEEDFELLVDEFIKAYRSVAS